MESSLKALLSNYTIDKDDTNLTHTDRIWARETGGRYYIGGKENLSKFYTSLCKANNLNEVYGITEKPFEISSPLRQDFDFRFKLDHGLRRVYTLEHLKRIHEFYCQVITESVADVTDEMFICLFSEKSKPRSEDGKVKDGIHLFFPHLYVDGWFIDHYVPERVTHLMKKDKMFSYEEQMESIDSLIDRKMAKKVWMMYGSVSSEKGEPYKVTHIFDKTQNEITIPDAFPSFFNSGALKGRQPEYYLPILMSIRRKEIPPVKMTPIVDAKKEAMKPKGASKGKSKYVPKKRSEADILEDLKRIDGDIMDMLSENRADTYDEWMDVGWTLFGIAEGNEKGLEMWIQFSKRSSKFKMGECEELWDKMDFRCGQDSGKPKTIGSILRMAKLDNPEAYNEWRESNVECVIEDSIKPPKPTHFRIAKVLHKTYEERFKCSKSKGDMWFEYRDNSWHYVDDGITIKRLLPTTIAQKYGAYQKKLSDEFDRAVNAQQNDAARNIQEKMKKIWKIIEFVECKQNIANCVDVAKTLFYEEDFHKTLDQNCWLIGDQNGVYDLKKGKHTPGGPDDKVSKQLGVPYIEYAWSDPEVVNVQKFLEEIFPNERIREYWLKSTAACLQAGNVNKKCYVWTNDNGDNGKTVTLKLVEMVFGNYFMNFDRNRFVANSMKSAGGPAPDVKRMIGRRLGAVKELAKNEPIDIGFLKFVTGNDTAYVRSHHEEGDDMQPQLTLIIMCNKPPKIPGNDLPTWNRIRVIPFESTFSKTAPATREEQKKLKIFPVDPNFTLKLPDMATAFYWLLLQYFKKYLSEGLNEPPEVTMDTSKYRTDNDVFMQFTFDRLKKTGNPEDKIHNKEVYEEFKEWYAENHPSYSKCNIGARAFNAEMTKGLLGQIGAKGNWCGFAFKDDDDGEESLGMG